MSPIPVRVRPRVMKPLVVPVVLLTMAAAATLAGCGGDGGGNGTQQTDTSKPPSAPATAMVQGTLQFAGGPVGNKPRTIPGTITFKGPDGTTATAPVDKSGKYSIGLNPGRYTIEGTSPLFDDGNGRCFTDPVTTTLVAGRTVTADVYCSIK